MVPLCLPNKPSSFRNPNEHKNMLDQNVKSRHEIPQDRLYVIQN